MHFNLFFKRSKINNIGRILFGFGSLFFGLEFMGDAVKPLASLDGFKQLMLDMSSNPILAVIVGAGLTALVQKFKCDDWYFTRILSTRFNQLKRSNPCVTRR